MIKLFEQKEQNLIMCQCTSSVFERTTYASSINLESESSSESLNTFRNVIAAENEGEIYRRIRLLENGQYYNLPPQNTLGDYPALVRENFNISDVQGMKVTRCIHQLQLTTTPEYHLPDARSSDQKH